MKIKYQEGNRERKVIAEVCGLANLPIFPMLFTILTGAVAVQLVGALKIGDVYWFLGAGFYAFMLFVCLRVGWSFYTNYQELDCELEVKDFGVAASTKVAYYEKSWSYISELKETPTHFLLMHSHNATAIPKCDLSREDQDRFRKLVSDHLENRREEMQVPMYKEFIEPVDPASYKVWTLGEEEQLSLAKESFLLNDPGSGKEEPKTVPMLSVIKWLNVIVLVIFASTLPYTSMTYFLAMVLPFLLVWAMLYWGKLETERNLRKFAESQDGFTTYFRVTDKDVVTGHHDAMDRNPISSIVSTGVGKDFVALILVNNMTMPLPIRAFENREVAFQFLKEVVAKKENLGPVTGVESGNPYQPPTV